MTRPTWKHIADTERRLEELALGHDTEVDYYLLAFLIDHLTQLQQETHTSGLAAAMGHGTVVGTIGSQGHASTVESRMTWPATDDPDAIARYGGLADKLHQQYGIIRRRWRARFRSLCDDVDRDLEQAASIADEREHRAVEA